MQTINQVKNLLKRKKCDLSVEFKKQQLNFFQELAKRHMEFMEKMLTEQKKGDEVEKKGTETFFCS